MSELSMSQRDTIRLAYRAAEKSGDDTVLQGRVRQLAKDFGISEDAVRDIAKGLKTAPPADSSSKPSGKRFVWTTKMLSQLKALHAQNLGPTAIAGQMGLEPHQVQQKLYLLKKQGVLSEPVVPTKEPALPSPAIKIPEIKAPDSIGEQLRQAVESVKSAFSTLPSQGSASARDSEYEKVLAKLAEPEPDKINLAKELLDLVDHFEIAYSAKPVLLQASPSGGWASCSFDVAGRRYSVSLRAKHREGSM